MTTPNPQLAAYRDRDAWEDVPLPTGAQPLPEWVKGAHINFMMDYANLPRVAVKVKGDVWEWKGQRWTLEERGNYRARHEDGRVQQLNHGGGVRLMTVWRTYAGDKPVEYHWMIPRVREGELPHEVAAREAAEKLADMKDRTNDLILRSIFGRKIDAAILRSEVKTLDMTTECYGGFGGGQYLLVMIDGSQRLLRGPWSGGRPPGCVEISTWDTLSQERDARWDWFRNKPWHQRGGRGGQYITEDLFLRIIARYAPHLRVARTEWGLEPYLIEWGMPKRQWQEAQK